ncbi:MAG: molybdate ABC transporter permease subunit, partial [Corynebacterium sp.]
MSDRTTKLSMGTATLWLSVIVLLPLVALTTEAFSGGIGGFWEAVSSEGARQTLWVTAKVSLVVAVINMVTGTLIAWVL